ncbi:MAG TPA: hypothetical protein VFU62_13555 [Hanamia sp.]|jgi:hypothetical protein|nr:hypothetical protein [Hanamia sp.]
MKTLLFLLYALFFANISYSQNVQKDSVSETQLKEAIQIYNHFSGDNAPIYNGRQYIYFTYKMEGDPYFISGNFVAGWVNYSHRKYDSVPLMYDLARNQLVILAPDKIYGIVLENDLIDSFSLHGHHFTKLLQDYKQNLNNTGFYDLLYNGQIQLLVKRVKNIDEQIKGDAVVRIFYSKDRYYVHKDSLYYLVSNKKDVLHLFKDKAHDLKKYMRKHHLKLRRKNFEEAMVKVTEFYDQLTH